MSKVEIQQETMTLTYKPDIEDWVKLYQYNEKHSRINQKYANTTRLYYMILFGFIALSMSLLITLNRKISLISTVFLLIIFYIPLSTTPIKSNPNNIRKMYDEEQNKFVREIITIEITPDYIQNLSSLYFYQYKYPLIEKIVNNPTAIYIFLLANNAIIIPDRAFASEQQKQACFELLNLYHSTKYA